MTEQEIKKTLDYLFEKGDVVELRILGAEHQGVVSGYFNDFDALAKSADKYSTHAEGIYITINPVNPALLARACNRVKSFAKNLTTEKDIIRRRWIPIDIDAIRPAGISSTNAEHEAAINKAYEINDGLDTMGMPEGIVADSGNGAHVLIRTDMSNTPESKADVEGIQKLIKDKFNNTPGLDVQMFADANRIWKLYGTWACKGDSIPARPHRISKILSFPEASDGGFDD
ncbi:MAG: hypothetical protein ABIF85_06140 [Nanoarchaeota archaeon]